jgi:putative membrane protein
MSKSQVVSVSVVGLATVLLALPVHAQGADDGKKDNAFVQEAGSGGLMEVRLGQLAQQKAQSPDVKNFGKRMVTDHTKANQQLASAAKKAGVMVPTKMAPKHQKEVSELSGKSGSGFDTAYMNMMVKDHMEDVQKFREEANSGKAESVRTTASKTLPVLQEHLSEAKHIAARVGADSTGASQSTSSSR